MKNNEWSWPFREPVDKNDAADYYDHIKYPMGEFVFAGHKSATSKVFFLF